MLYTTYLSNLKNVPEEKQVLLVTRIVPKGLDLNKHNSIIHTPELAPSQSLLMQYKYDDDWNRFRLRFVREMKSRKDMKKKLKEIKEDLKDGKDIYLVCYEKEYRYCHRYLLGQWAVQEGFEWAEV